MFEIKKEDIDLRNILEHEGVRFNKNNKACCPFHNERTPSFSIKNNRYKCFGCGAGGDVINFIRNYKNYDYVQACKYLGIDLDEERQRFENQKDMIIKYALKFHKDKRVTDIYTFTNFNGDILYYKLKLVDSNNKKITPYYSIVNGIIEPKRVCDEVPYNFKGLNNGLINNKKIFIVEGEKDANALIHLGYIATSFKGVTKFDWSLFQDSIVYVIGDTGDSGQKYIEQLWSSSKDYVSEFNVVELTGLEKLGDNKDVSDWLESGYTDKDLRVCIENNSWDYKKSTLWKDIEPKYKTVQGEKILTGYIPLKTWNNLDLILKRNNIALRYNIINKEIESTTKTSRNELLTDIYTLNTRAGLKMERAEVKNSISKIASIKKYNPFTEYLNKNINKNHTIINDVFECLTINPDFKENIELYKTYWMKWLINVVRQSHNTLEHDYAAQGVLVLQGKQGIRKTTFFRELMPKKHRKDWFKEGHILDPTDKDNIMQCTTYILCELGELDATMKSEQAKLKAFITNTFDQFRAPYDAYAEIFARLTTFCATVNKPDFLKDETGNRRWWIIPIVAVNVEKMKSININEFWGAVYDLYLSDTIKCYLTSEEQESQNKINLDFSAETNISLALDESYEFGAPEDEWIFTTLTEISEVINTKDTKAIKNELEKRGYIYKPYKINGKTQRGVKMPREKSEALNRLANKAYKDNKIEKVNFR